MSMNRSRQGSRSARFSAQVGPPLEQDPFSKGYYDAQIDWLTRCVYALQEQNRQLYAHVSDMHKLVQYLLTSGVEADGAQKNNSWPGDQLQVFSNNNLVRKESGGSGGGGAAQPQTTNVRPRALSLPFQSQIKVTVRNTGNSAPRKYTKEELEIFKKWGNRSIPSSRGKPIDPDKLAALSARLRSKTDPKKTNADQSAVQTSNSPLSKDQAKSQDLASGPAENQNANKEADKEPGKAPESATNKPSGKESSNKDSAKESVSNQASSQPEGENSKSANPQPPAPSKA